MADSDARVDGGTQGVDYRSGEGYDFGTASLVFTWRSFDGGGDEARARQARAAERQVVLRQEEIAQQIRLEVQQAFDRLTTARDSLATAAARADAARAAFRIASRKRDEGVISQVEFIDARSALTGAELNHNVTRFDVLARTRSSNTRLRPARSRSSREPDHAYGQDSRNRGARRFVAGCNSKATVETPAATPVRVAIATGPAAPSIRTNGLLANKDEIRLSFKVGGVIRKLSVSEVEHVRKGQPLAEIEQTEANAQVEQARQAHEKAKRDASRGERLYEDKVISLEQLQDLRTQAAVAEAGAELRRVQLELRRNRRAARRDSTAPTCRRARAGCCWCAGARNRRTRQRFHRAHRPRGSRDRASAARRRRASASRRAA